MSQYSSPVTQKPTSPITDTSPTIATSNLVSAAPSPKPVPKSSKVGPYVLSKTLGMGSTGRVKLGIHHKTNAKVAIKIIPKQIVSSSTSPQNMSLKIEREIVIMKLIKHPNVMQLYDVYETDDELYLVLEYVEGGELFDYLVKRGRLDEREACKFFQQIILGLDFCHKHQICHRDLKPENLLLDSNRKIKIADFGMASLQRPDKMLETSCGSPHYASPEIIKGIKYDGSKSDIWSCGVILYALISGNLPFDDENIRRLLSKVKTGKFHMPPHMSPNAQDLIEKMLNVDPDLRIGMDEIIQHPWFNQVAYPESTTAKVFQPDHPPIPIDELDADILNSLSLIGWSDKSALTHALTSTDPTFEKVYYHLLRIGKEQYFYNNGSCGFNDQDPDLVMHSGDSLHMDDDEVNSRIRRRAESLASVFTDKSKLPGSDRAHRSEANLLTTSTSNTNISKTTTTTTTTTTSNQFKSFHKPTHSSPLSITTKSTSQNEQLTQGSQSATESSKTPVTPKKSWFAQLISSFKPYMIQVNQKSLNANETMHVLKNQVLPNMKIKVQEGRKGGIKCKSEIPNEVKHLVKVSETGPMAAIKFRIDISDGEHGCLLTFSLQQGPMVVMHYIIKTMNTELGSIVGVSDTCVEKQTIIQDLSVGVPIKSVVHHHPEPFVSDN